METICVCLSRPITAITYFHIKQVVLYYDNDGASTVPANSSFVLISKAGGRRLGNGGNKEPDKDAFERGF